MAAPRDRGTRGQQAPTWFIRGGDDAICAKQAEGDGLNDAVEARAQAVGSESRGERKCGKPRTGASGTEQGGALAAAIQGAIQRTGGKALCLAQRQEGSPQGLNGRGMREDAPGLDHAGRGEKDELV